MSCLPRAHAGGGEVPHLILLLCRRYSICLRAQGELSFVQPRRGADPGEGPAGSPEPGDCGREAAVSAGLWRGCNHPAPRGCWALAAVQTGVLCVARCPVTFVHWAVAACDSSHSVFGRGKRPLAAGNQYC